MPINSISGAFSTAEQVRHTESAAAKGAFMGNAVVQQPSPESLLADAAEELTFSADTTDDFELEERKERDKIKKSEEDRVKLYQELMQERAAQSAARQPAHPGGFASRAGQGAGVFSRSLGRVGGSQADAGRAAERGSRRGVAQGCGRRRCRA